MNRTNGGKCSTVREDNSVEYRSLVTFTLSLVICRLIRYSFFNHDSWYERVPWDSPPPFVSTSRLCRQRTFHAHRHAYLQPNCEWDTDRSFLTMNKDSGIAAQAIQLTVRFFMKVDDTLLLPEIFSFIRNLAIYHRLQFNLTLSESI